MNDAPAMRLSWSAAGGRPWLLIALLAVIPLWNHPYFEELKSPNPLSRTYLTRALFDHHVVNIDAVQRQFGDVSDRARRGGHSYCDKAPGSSFLLVPVYALLRINHRPEDVSHQRLLMWGSVILGVIPTFFALACLDAILVMLGISLFSRRVALAAWGLGSVGVPFELLFFGHQLAACFVVFTWWAALRAVETNRRSLAIVAGLAAGFAVITEYPTTLLILLLALWSVVAMWRDPALRARRLVGLVGGVVAGSLLPLALGMAYHDAAFGGPLTTGYAFIDNPFFASVHHKGVMGVSLPTLEGLGGTLFSANRGLFYFQPYLLLWPLGAWFLARSGRRAEGLFIVVICALYIMFAAGFGYWLGGWSLGPRHLVPSVPFFVAGFAAALHRFERSARTAGQLVGASARGLVLWSVVVVGLACITHSGYPEEFIHPFFQMTLPLVRGGFFPYSVGTALGTSRAAAAIVPVLALLLVAATLVLVGRRRVDLWKCAVTLGTAAALFFALGSIVKYTPEASHRLAWIMDTVWEPRRHDEPKRPDPVKLAPTFGNRPVRQDERNHVGRHHARRMEIDRALEEYARGVAAGEAGRH